VPNQGASDKEMFKVITNKKLSSEIGMLKEMDLEIRPVSILIRWSASLILTDIDGWTWFCKLWCPDSYNRFNSLLSGDFMIVVGSYVNSCDTLCIVRY
jgi:hypothetical protein